jgi:hypothetical protein
MKLKSSIMSAKSFGNASAKTAGFAIASLALSLLATAPAQATRAVFFNSTSAGANQFDTTVTGAGGSVTTDSWANLPSGQTSIDRGDYSFTRINGNSLYGTSYGTLNGSVISIDPSSRDVQTSRASGIQFTFDTPVNALGFEVGDWGTCCQPSALYMSFDNGPAIQVGLSTVPGDVRYNNRYEAFVGAIDDVGTFSTVQFWGDGLGEVLVAGGTIRYGDVGIGNLPGGTAVPEPFTIIGSIMGGTAALRMRKKLKDSNKA